MICGELGEYSQDLHEKIGDVVVKNKIDILICVGNESKNIVNIAQKEGVKNIYHCNTNQEAINILNKTLNKNDAVLLKASNSLKFSEICDAIC